MPEEQLRADQEPGAGAVPHAAQGQAGGSHCLLRRCVASAPALGFVFGLQTQVGAGHGALALYSLPVIVNLGDKACFNSSNLLDLGEDGMAFLGFSWLVLGAEQCGSVLVEMCFLTSWQQKGLHTRWIVKGVLFPL